MSEGEKVLVILVFAWALWLIWHGRNNSPRRRRDDARFMYLLEQAKRDREAGR